MIKSTIVDMVVSVNQLEPAMPVSILSDSLQRLTHTYKSRLREAVQEKQLALPITHIRVLKGVCRNPECTAQSIARRMQRDKAQITRVLKELLSQGLVEKVGNPHDRRSQLLRPTEQGRQIMQELRALERQTAGVMTKSLSQDEIEQFVRLADVMAANLTGDLAPRKGSGKGK